MLGIKIDAIFKAKLNFLMPAAFFCIVKMVLSNKETRKDRWGFFVLDDVIKKHLVGLWPVPWQPVSGLVGVPL
jgi:hypothetical protein